MEKLLYRWDASARGKNEEAKNLAAERKVEGVDGR